MVIFCTQEQNRPVYPFKGGSDIEETFMPELGFESNSSSPVVSDLIICQAGLPYIIRKV